MCDKGPCASLHTSVAPVDTLFSPYPGIAVGRNGGLCLAPRHATSSRDQDTPWGSGWPPSCMFPPLLACRQETQSSLQMSLTQGLRIWPSSCDTGELEAPDLGGQPSQDRFLSWGVRSAAQAACSAHDGSHQGSGTSEAWACGTPQPCEQEGLE